MYVCDIKCIYLTMRLPFVNVLNFKKKSLWIFIVILLVFKWFKNVICAVYQSGSKLFKFCCVFVYVGASWVYFVPPFPLLFFLYIFGSVYGYHFRLSGGPADTYVSSFQRQQQHHFLQWKICPSSVLQSTR